MIRAVARLCGNGNIELRRRLKHTAHFGIPELCGFSRYALSGKALKLVDSLTEAFALLGGKTAHFFEKSRYLAVFAEKSDSHAFKIVRALYLRQTLLQFTLQFKDLTVHT